MSKGRLIKPRNPNYPENPLEKNVYDIIHRVVPTFEIEIENEEWEKADEELKEELNEIDNQIIAKVESIEEKISSIEKRLGSNEGNLTDELKRIKQEIENIKKRKPLDVIIKVDNKKPNDIGTQHFQFPALLQILSTKLNVYLVGPAGSGKTTAAINCAK